jgi:hypothetical protein
VTDAWRVLVSQAEWGTFGQNKRDDTDHEPHGYLCLLNLGSCYMTTDS